MAEEYLVFNIGDVSTRMKVGKSYLLLGVATSDKGARELVESLPAATASKVLIVARKAVVRRVPAVRLEDVDESVLDEGA